MRMDGDNGNFLCGGGNPHFMPFKKLQVLVLQSLETCIPEEVLVCPGNSASQEVTSWLVPSSLLSGAFSQPELELLLPPSLQAGTS